MGGAMPRRKEIKGILNGFSSSFVSRNNDVEGYWGLGKFYKFAASQNTNKIVIDILSNHIVPPEPSFRPYIKVYAKSILDDFSSRGLPHDWLVKATITIIFNQDDQADEAVVGHLGEPFIGTIDFEDDLNRLWSKSIRGRCRKHDPLQEHRSLRK